MNQARKHSDGSKRLVYSVEEAAELLGIGRTLMFKLVGTGEIESVKIGNRRKICPEALRSYIERLRTERAVIRGDPPDKPRQYTSGPGLAQPPTHRNNSETVLSHHSGNREHATRRSTDEQP